MPFRDGWLPVGILLVFVGFGAGEAAISGVGMVILALGAVARYWSRHLFDRLTLTITASERRAWTRRRWRYRPRNIANGAGAGP